ncbi:DeoR family transcriptional regulator [Bhargavaea beijingensis]|uniref:DeoR family transcriptional regulator n=1 Tax=Bhargavaea beijingensis TaxID=426756 RepID=UPI002ADE3633|nr:DeoR family transcriptional regulator [Bhargavaea beijingensis]
MLLPVERQQQILTWIEEEGALKVSEASRRLGVSEMTVYRDIQPLTEQGKILKTSNGLARVSLPTVRADHCVYCGKGTSSRFAVQIIRADHGVEQACCAHCGLLRYGDAKEDVAQVICRDYLADTTIGARSASFLIGADVRLNCCDPQVLVFGSRKDAERFRAGFGGELYGFDEAIQAVKEEMDGGACCRG